MTSEQIHTANSEAARTSIAETVLRNAIAQLSESGIQLSSCSPQIPGKGNRKDNAAFFSGSRRELITRDARSILAPADIGVQEPLDADGTKWFFSSVSTLVQAKKTLQQISVVPNAKLTDDDRELKENFAAVIQQTENQQFAQIPILKTVFPILSVLLDQIVPSKGAFAALTEQNVAKYYSETGITVENPKQLFIICLVLEQIFLLLVASKLDPEDSSPNKIYTELEDLTHNQTLDAQNFIVSNSQLSIKASLHHLASTEIKNGQELVGDEPIPIVYQDGSINVFRLQRAISQLTTQLKNRNLLEYFLLDVQLPSEFYRKNYSDINLSILITVPVTSTGTAPQNKTFFLPARGILRSPNDASSSKAPILQITNVKRFFILLDTLLTVSKKSKNYWTNRQDPLLIWKNATWFDLQFPEQYLAKIILQMQQTEKLTKFSGRSIQLKVNDSHYIASLTVTSPHKFMEAGTDIALSIRTDDGNDSVPGELAHLRVGLTDVTEATVYALQMPKQEVSSAQAEQGKKQLETLSESAAAGLIQLYDTDRELFELLFTIKDIPESALQFYPDNPMQFLIEFMSQLAKAHAKSIEPVKYSYQLLESYDDYYHSLFQFITYKKIQNDYQLFEPWNTQLRELQSALKEIKSIPGMQRIIDRLTAKNIAVRAFNSPLRFKTKPDKFTELASEFKKQSPALLVSVVSGIAALHAHGITTVRIPKNLPLRPHSAQDTARIYNQLNIVFQRAVYELDGFTEIDPPTGADSSFSYFSIGELSSKQPILQALLDGFGV